MTSKPKSARRQWSIAEKRRIATEALQPGTNKAALARRYGISDSQLYAWRKALGDDTHARFLPVITDETSPNSDDGSSSSIDIVLSNGHRRQASCRQNRRAHALELPENNVTADSDTAYNSTGEAQGEI